MKTTKLLSMNYEIDYNYYNFNYDLSNRFT